MLSEQWPYLGLILVLVIDSLGAPIPEDVPLLTAGWLCYRGLADVRIMILVGFVGVMCGDLILFGLGRYFGQSIVGHKWFRRVVDPKRLLLAEKLFARHGIKMIFVARFIPVLRPVLFIASGVLRVRPAVFAVVDGCAACISVPAMVLLGMFFGATFDQLKQDVRTGTLIIGLILFIAMFVGIYIFIKRRQKNLPDPAADDGEAAEAKSDALTKKIRSSSAA
jgi:membrane protein DedA with SNARE-associated domain